jgi:hypothetical protein
MIVAVSCPYCDEPAASPMVQFDGGVAHLACRQAHWAILDAQAEREAQEALQRIAEERARKRSAPRRRRSPHVKPRQVPWTQQVVGVNRVDDGLSRLIERCPPFDRHEWADPKKVPRHSPRPSGRLMRQVVQRRLEGQTLKTISIDLGIPKHEISTMCSVVDWQRVVPAHRSTAT